MTTRPYIVEGDSIDHYPVGIETQIRNTLRQSIATLTNITDKCNAAESCLGGLKDRNIIISSSIEPVDSRHMKIIMTLSDNSVMEWHFSG